MSDAVVVVLIPYILKTYLFCCGTIVLILFKKFLISFLSFVHWSQTHEIM